MSLGTGPPKYVLKNEAALLNTYHFTLKIPSKHILQRKEKYLNLRK